MDLLRAFLGNGLVITFQCAAVENVSQWMNVGRRNELLAGNPMTCVLYVVRAEPI